MRFGIKAIILGSCAFFALAPLAIGQDAPAAAQPAKLADLLDEAARTNPQIQAARHAWESAKQVPSQVSTLPDPQIVLQNVSVGSPVPFAGLTNSDFAYIGLGISQDLPYPGKLRLRGEAAKRDADALEQRFESVKREVLAAIESAYYRLAYFKEQGTLLQGDQTLLREIEQSAEGRYRSGMGNQHDVLQAQLEQTKLLREITSNRLEAGKTQASMKQLLNRMQVSPDIEAGALHETALGYTFEELLDAARMGNPEAAETQEMAEKQELQVKLAKKDFYPDFNVQYMWQRTDPNQFRAYYQLTFSARIPIYRNKRQRPELAQAEADQERARSEYESKQQELAAKLREQFVTAKQTGELLNIYHDGLLPQSQAELEAGLAAYQSNREDFQALLASFLDVLKLHEEYWETLSEREIAIAQMERISGLQLHAKPSGD